MLKTNKNLDNFNKEVLVESLMYLYTDDNWSFDWPKMLSSIMEEAVFTQKDLASALGTQQQSISNWMNGKRSPPGNYKIEILNMGLSIKLLLADFLIKKVPKKNLRLDKRGKTLISKLSKLNYKQRDKILSDLKKLYF
jgi:transcriptional regulator with XRE-family HTH domain